MRWKTLLLLALLAVTACAQAQSASQPEPTPALDPALGVTDPSVFEATTDFPAPIAGALGPVQFPLDVNPLTGLVVDDPAVLQRRPIVAKISNAPPLVRPQAGVGQADLVYEHYAEGGLTRFSAV
ncbi:MAG TPA: DUF3048 domain-containing protein, partial [Aggregatilineales bacterium]|nr:DUF3048 domain-containing protein [Aggregatilineales bacterium]